MCNENETDVDIRLSSSIKVKGRKNNEEIWDRKKFLSVKEGKTSQWHWEKTKGCICGEKSRRATLISIWGKNLE